MFLEGNVYISEHAPVLGDDALPIPATNAINNLKDLGPSPVGTPACAGLDLQESASVDPGALAFLHEPQLLVDAA
jgi:hypothetical protein